MAENKEFYLVIKGEKVIVSEEVYACCSAINYNVFSRKKK